MVRARYGTGVLLKLNKRNCNIRIRLTPCGSDFTKVQMKIGCENNVFFLSGTMGSQFSSLLRAIYCLYDEEDLKHWIFHRRGQKTLRNTPQGNEELPLTRVDFSWDNEHHSHTITLWRESDSYMPMLKGIPDPVKIIFWRTYGKRREFTVDGRDLCYAVAKACTEALKKYGFKGYLKSGGEQYLGDTIDIEILLFIKAYALGVLDVRETKQLWRQPKGWMHAEASSFDKEIELFLFDM
jgi:hypothetical protein